MYLYVKRAIDLVLALILFVMLLPVFLVIVIAIKLDSKGSAIFKQKRSGLKGKEFTLYKFRSMTICNDVKNFKEENKYTKIGKMIRDLSIDEIPQLINIIKGDMSFIGPRPWIIDYAKVFTREQMKRLDVRPGITGLAQSSGRNSLSIEEKINYDIKYVNNLSFTLDCKIIFDTIKSVIEKDSVDITKSGIKEELEYLRKNYENSLSK